MNKIIKMSVLMTVCIISLYAFPVYSATKYINKAASGANNGTSWTDAYQSVSNALAAAADGDEFWVASGVYSNDPIALSAPNVKVYGGFAGTETARTQRNWSNNVVKLDGAGNKRVMLVTSTNVTIDGINYQFAYNGTANGAAINSSGDDLKIFNCNFTSNFIEGYFGGGIYSSGDRLMISSCIFSNNYGGNWNSFGFAICATKNVTINDSTFVTNRSGVYHGAGAIYIDGSSAMLSVSNCLFLDNVSKSDGPIPRGCGSAICINQGNLSAKNSAFVNNVSWYYGGAIWLNGGSSKTALVENCTFYTNRAQNFDGGAICATNSSGLLVTNSIFWGNACNGSGRGMEIFSSQSGSASINYSSLTATNSTYVYLNSGTPTITNTITGDPLFSSTTKPYDVHEKSQAGHWSVGGWVYDGVSSPCIDAGDPTSPSAVEPANNGGRINMGAYGNTVQASKSGGPPPPEMDMYSNTTAIADGDITPSVAEGTDFSNVAYSVSLAVTNTFVITNSGAGTLYLTNPSIVVLTGDTTEFTVDTTGTSTNISVNGSTTFKVVFDPTSLGLKAAVVTIANDDSDENPYNFNIQGTGVLPSPEMDMCHNSTAIADGDVTPSSAEGTDFGSVLYTSGSITNTFIITNSGSATLYLTNATGVVLTGDTTEFTVNTNGMSTNIAAGSFTTFTIMFDPTSAGTKVGTITIANNDSNEDPYDFSIQGTGLTPTPEMDMFSNATAIADGDVSPTVAKGTDFGSLVYTVVAAVTNTFTITNTGSAVLYLTNAAGVVLTGDTTEFTVVTNGMSTNIAMGASTTFKVVFDPTSAGAKNGVITIENNDSNEDPYNFNIQGTGLNPSPEMNMYGNAMAIADGDVTPSATDGTDFGDVVFSLSAAVTNIFVITNTGTATLYLTNASGVVLTGDTTEFAVNTNGMSTNIAAGSSTTFTVIFDPTSAGLKNGVITIENNDSNEDPYNFNIQGNGALPSPEMDLYGTANAIPDGDISPTMLKGTDFGGVLYTSGAITNTFTITNTGAAVLYLTNAAGVVLTGDTTEFAVVTNGMSTNIAIGASTTFKIVFDPTSAGTKTGIVTIANNDTNEDPYNFNIQGAGAFIRFVDKDAGGANNGTSWANAYQDLSNALAAATEGTELWVAEGVYASDPITISSSNISVYGGFVGTETLRSQRSWFANAVILDGSSTKRIMTINGAGVLIDGLTFKGGSDQYGGAIYMAANNLKLYNSTFTNNSMSGGPSYGTVYFSGYGEVTNCLFIDNYISSGGGDGAGGAGIYGQGDITVKDSSFINNRCMDWKGKGGAIYFKGSGKTLTLTNCLFSGNYIGSDDSSSDKGKGGAILISGGNLDAYGCNFVTNCAKSSTGLNAGGAAGAIYSYSASSFITLRNCAFAGNYSDNYFKGGAINVASNIALINCSFYSNIHNQASTGGGGAVYAAGSIFATNCIFWSNIGGISVGNQLMASGQVTIVYSCINSTAPADILAPTVNIGAGVITGDPLFVSDYDLHEKSQAGHWTSSGWILDVVSSPCIDAGNPGSAYANEPLPNAGRINMGAYGNTLQASKSVFVAFSGVMATNIAKTSADVIATLVKSNATCSVLYDTNNWGQVLTDWKNTNNIGAIPAGTVITNNIAGLTPNTLYYYIFYGTNAALGSYGYSTSGVFSTISEPNLNNDGGATNIMAKTATLRCTVVTSHQANVTIYYGTTDGGTTIGSWSLSTNAGIVTEGTYSLDVGNLSTGQLYYYRAYATNAAGDAWATTSASFMSTPGISFVPWNKKMKIRFQSYNRAEALTNIPLLVTLSNNINNSGFSYSDLYSTNGYDLRFSDDTGINELPFEVEKWDTNGTSYIWVKMPVLSNSNAAIWMYAGRDWLTNWPSYSTDGTVWENGFRAVWHLNMNEQDSGLFKKHGTVFNNVTNALGQIAGCKSFDNSASWIDVPEIATSMNQVTYSMWMKLPSMPDNLDAILNTDNWNPSDMQLMFLNTGKIRLSINGNTPEDADSTYAFGAGDWDQWRYVTVVYDRVAKSAVFYVDAVPGATNLYAAALAGNITAANIGSYNIARYLNGLVDEFSIADSARSSNWIWACYMNMASNSDFMTYGGMSNICPITWSTPTVTNIAAVSADFIATLTGSNADCVVVYDTNNWGMSLGKWKNTNAIGSIVSGVTITNNVIGLESNTYYYFMYYGTNTALGAHRFSEAKSFTTISLPVVNNDGGATNITGISALLGYTVVTSHTANVTLYYGTTDGGTTIGNWQHSVNIGVVADTGSYSTAIGNLIAGTTYYYRCYATNLAGSSWSTTTTNFAMSNPVYVDTNVVGGANNGSSWADAYKDLALALSNAPANSMIWIAQGTYANSTAFRVSSNGVSIYGGFASGLTWEQRNWSNNVTILDGANVRQIMTNSAANVIIDGLRFIRGSSTTNGVALCSSGSNLMLVNCMIASNSAQNVYGVMYFSAATTISNCLFFTNSVGNSGWDKGGAGFYAKDSDVTVIGSRFDSCVTRDYRHNGAGISFNGAGKTLSVSNCVFIRNATLNGDSSGWGYGAGIHVAQGILKVYGSEFISNAAYRAGAAISSFGSSNSIRNCSFALNQANREMSGGAICVTGSLEIASCSFYSNKCNNIDGNNLYGGAVYCGKDLVIENSIFWHDIGPNVGKEIYAANVYMTNACITGTNDAYMSITGIKSLENLIVIDPYFISPVDLHLQSPNGRWDVASSSWTNDLLYSPCIDAGNAASPYSNEPIPNGGRINLGAYGNTVYASKTVPESMPVASNSTSSVYFTVAVIRGAMQDGTRGALTIYYDTNDWGMASNNWAHSANFPFVGEGVECEAIASGLPTNTTYYYRTYVTNTMGDDWADTAASFTSGPATSGGPAGTIHVDPSKTPPLMDGSCWEFAYNNIADALKVIQQSNQIWIADGNCLISSKITLNVHDVSIYGGFSGSETNLNQRDWTNNIAILDGQNMANILDITATNVRIDGLTFTRAYQNLGDGKGAVIKSAGYGFKLYNCSITNNTAAGNPYYGIVYVSNDTEVVNCLFATNRITSGGGNGGAGAAIFAQDCNLTIIDTIFYKCGANSWKGRGGAIAFDGTNKMLSITNCVFNRNYIDSDESPGGGARKGAGGAILILNGALDAMGCSFVSNTTIGPGRGGTGAAIANYGSYTTLKNCAFAANEADRYVSGGAIMATGGMTVINCSFSSNRHYNVDSLSGGGGAIYCGGDLFVENSIFWQNNGAILNGNDVWGLNIFVTNSCSTAIDNTSLYATGSRLVADTMSSDPRFASYVDLHLMSENGRWDPAITNWVLDVDSSPCIDAGNTNYPWANEPMPNGGRINLGAYGNTIFASKSVSETSPIVENSTNNVQSTSAIIRGKLTGGKKGIVTIYYGNNDGWDIPALWDNKAVFSNVAQGTEVALSLEGLAPLSPYFYRCYVTNSIGDFWATDLHGPSTPSMVFNTGDSPVGGTNVIHVDPNQTGLIQNGTKWDFAYDSFEKAIVASSTLTNEIWIADGTLLFSSTIDINVPGLLVFGGFSGNETSRDQRDWTNNVIRFDGGGVRRLMNVYASDVTLDGLYLTRAYGGNGFVVSARGNAFKLYNCSVTNNIGFISKGGIYIDGSGSSVHNTKFLDNQITGWDTGGAAIYCASNDLTVSDCLFMGNRYHSFRGNGGAIYYDGSSVSKKLTVVYCRFYTNSCATDMTWGGLGGAIFANSGILDVKDCEFISNSATGSVSGSGGAINSSGSKTYIQNSIFVGNVGCAAVPGGAISVTGDLVMINCSFNTNCHLNADGISGGGAAAYASNNIFATNCIFWSNNGNTTYGHELCSSGTVNVAYSCFTGINDTYVRASSTNYGAGVIVADPCFVSITDVQLMSKAGRWNGTAWVYDAVTSPCVDAGDPAYNYSQEPYPNGGRINMGAYGGTIFASKTSIKGSVIIIR